eukprot:PhF_6_TR927/c1_g1_i1/m.1597
MSINDLQTLLKEAIKRKEKALQLACEQCVPTPPGSPFTADSMKPYVLGCSLTKQPKIVAICVTVISSVCCTTNADSVPSVLLHTLMTALCSINLKEVITEESIGVRLLQTYSVVLTNPGVGLSPLVVASSLSQLMTLFTLHPKGTITQSTARATLTQLSGHYFDALKDVEVPDAQAVRTASLLLRDYCQIADGNTGQWLRLPATTHPLQCLVLDLAYEAVCAHNVHMKKFHSVFVPILRDDMCVCVVRGMSAALDTQLSPRFHRISVVLLQYFMESLSENLDMIFGIQTHALEHKSMDNMATKAAVLMPWRQVFQSGSLLKTLAIKVSLFSAFISNVCTLMRSLGELIIRNNDKLVVSLAGDRLTPAKLEGCRDDDVRPQDVFVLAFDVICGVSASLAKLVDREKGVVDPCVALYIDALWTPILQECSELLVVAQDEDIVQSTLRCCQNMTHCCGWCGKSTARDSFITCMTKHALPNMSVKPYVLTSHNVSIIKVLVNISNGLASVLGSSWYVILKTFQQVECVLAGLSAEQAAVHDAAMLQALLDNVMESSKFVEDKALLQMIQGLVQVSTDISVGREPLKARPGYFSLMKMALAIKHNMPRLALIQEICSTHFITMATTGEDQEMRKVAVECTGATLTTYFQQGRLAGSGSTTELDIAMFGTLSTIQKKSNDGEVRYMALLELNKVFQVVGQSFGTACMSMTLVMLQTAAEASTSDEVTYGYRTVELICHDFLSVLDNDSMLQLIQCVAAYIHQTSTGERVSLNLSAIQLVWQIGDYCSTKTNASLSVHWLALFALLRDASLDTRPEVRHGALKTLFSLLVTHGKALPEATRPKVLWDILVRLMTSLQAVVASHEEHPSVGGMDESPSKLLVHHTRNTAAKQWSETVAVTVEGCVRAARVFNEEGASSIGTWTDFLKSLTAYITHAVLSLSDEVSCIGIKSLNALINDLSVDKTVQPAAIWDVAWTCWEQYAELPHKSEGGVQTNLSMFIEGFLEHKEKCSGSWTNLCTRRLFAALEKVSKSQAAITSFFFPSKVQSSILNVLKKLLPLEDNGQWEALYNLVGTFLPSQAFIDTVISSELPPAQIHSQFVSNGFHFDFVDATLGFIKDSVTKCKPEVKMMLAPIIVRPVLGVWMTRFVQSSQNYKSWKAATIALHDIIADLLTGIRSLHTSQLTALKEVSVTFHKFYFSPHSSSRIQSQGFIVEPEDTAAVRIANLILRCPHIGTDATKAFLSFLEKCSLQTFHLNVRREALVSLFDLVNGEESLLSESAALIALPVVVLRCKTIISEYSVDDRSAGRVPLASHRHEEIIFVLKTVRSLTVNPALWTASAWNAPTTEHSQQQQPPQGSGCTHQPAAFGRKGVLIRLFPVLCDLMGCKADDVKALLAATCKDISLELGIP